MATGGADGRWVISVSEMIGEGVGGGRGMAVKAEWSGGMGGERWVSAR